MIPLISIIMPVYNGGKFVRSGIDSVLEQTYAHWELIIVDDGSTDDSAQIIKQCRDPRVKYVYQANAGPLAARNHGLECAQGEYVIFLDCDDWWSRDALEVLLAAALKHPGAIVHGDWAYASSREHVGRVNSSLIQTPDPLQTLVLRNPFCIHAILTPIKLLRESGGFTRQMPTLEDWELWRNLAMRGGRFAHVPELVAYYYWHSGSRSKDALKRKTERLATLHRFWAREDAPAAVRHLKGKSFGTAYIDFCVAELSHDDEAAAWQEFDDALRHDPDTATSVDTYYRIAFSDQAASEHSRVHMIGALDEERAGKHIEGLIKHIQGLPDSTLNKKMRQQAVFAAYQAMGLANYHIRNHASARKWWRKALRVAPSRAGIPRQVFLYAKSMLPLPVLDGARRAKRLFVFKEAVAG